MMWEPKHALGMTILARIASLRLLIEALDIEISLFTNVVRGWLAYEPGYTAVQQIPSVEMLPKTCLIGGM
jgi:hypothetical protein